MVYWDELSSNPTMIEILEKNQDKICYYNLSSNTGIFPLVPKADIRLRLRAL
jgi:hypothetical protein